MTVLAFNTLNAKGWRSLSVAETLFGFAVSESADRFPREHLAEAITRCAGLVIVIASFGFWAVPPEVFAAGGGTRTLLAGLFLSVGLFVYAFATRGFRREVQFLSDRRQIRLVALNSTGRARITRTVDHSAIESLYVRRRTMQDGNAQLCLRIAGEHTPVLLLRGRQCELEDLHRRLSEDVRTARISGRIQSAWKKHRPVFGAWRPA